MLLVVSHILVSRIYLVSISVSCVPYVLILHKSHSLSRTVLEFTTHHIPYKGILPLSFVMLDFLFVYLRDLALLFSTWEDSS